MFAAIPVIAAAVLGLWRIDQKGLWPDEAFSARVAGLDPRMLWQVVTSGDADAAFTAFYYGLLHFWQRWSDSEIWLRLPSVAFGIATIVTRFALNNRLLGLSAATVSARFWP